MVKASLPKRIAWTALHLAKEPRHATRYVRENLLGGGRTPVELALPWFSYGAVDWLHDHVSPSTRVLEFGAGGSSLFFAARGCAVRSIEHDPVWAAEVRRRAADLPGVVEIELVSENAFTESAARLLSPADVVVIDCLEAPDNSIRPGLLAQVECDLEPALVVVDDSWRYAIALAGSCADSVLRFDGLGPGRRGRTETAILRYRRNG